jgi:hypothetical protein
MPSQRKLQLPISTVDALLGLADTVFCIWRVVIHFKSPYGIAWKAAMRKSITAIHQRRLSQQYNALQLPKKGQNKCNVVSKIFLSQLGKFIRKKIV